MKTIKLGGNKFKLKMGYFLSRISERIKAKADRLIKKGNPITISNPTCKFVNPFTLIINFTVNNVDKYQLVHEGDFKEKYKFWADLNQEEVDVITEDEMFIIIGSSKNRWFLKNKTE